MYANMETVYLLACFILPLSLSLSLSFYFFIASVHSFFYTFLKSGIDKSAEWSTIPVVLALCALLTGMIPKGLILQNFCVQLLCMFCFMYICVRTDFVVYG